MTTAGRVDCAGRHGLAEFTTPTPFSCSFCFRVWPAGSTMFGCRGCDTDACEECRSHGGAVAVVWDLHVAARAGDVEAIRRLVGMGADVEAWDDEGGRSALQVAAASGHVEAMRALVACGADVNAASSNGVTAIMRAADEGHEAAVVALVALGADVEAAHEFGATALICAAPRGMWRSSGHSRSGAPTWRRQTATA